MGNFYFVNLWRNILMNSSLVNNLLAKNNNDILFSIARLIIWLFLYFIYSVRRIFVPFLFAVSPLFLWLFSLGEKFKPITVAWLKELIGGIYIQSLHAVVLCFVVYCMDGNTDIEAIIMWACLIPITCMLRNITGIGGRDMLNAAANLTRTGANTIGAGLSAAGSIAGAGLGSALGVAGSTIGESFDNKLGTTGLSSLGFQTGKAMGNALGDTAGGLGRVGTGLGLSMIGENGDSNISQGVAQIDHGVAGGLNSIGNPLSSSSVGNRLADLEQAEDHIRADNRGILNPSNPGMSGTISSVNGGDAYQFTPNPDLDSTTLRGNLGQTNRDIAWSSKSLTNTIKENPMNPVVNARSRYCVGDVSRINENIERMKDLNPRPNYTYTPNMAPEQVRSQAVDSIRTYQSYKDNVSSGNFRMSQSESNRIQQNYEKTCQAFNFASMSCYEDNGKLMLQGVDKASNPTYEDN